MPTLSIEPTRLASTSAPDWSVKSAERSAPGSRPIRSVHGQPAWTLPSATSGPGVPRDHAVFEKAPTLAVLSTTSDKPVDWVRAGQALERVLLEATAAGISASLMNQPVEQDDLRWQVRNPLTGIGHGHMLLRLGYGSPVPATPRALSKKSGEPRLSRRRRHTGSAVRGSRATRRPVAAHQGR